MYKTSLHLTITYLARIIVHFFPTDEVEVLANGRPRLMKSKSAAPETLFKNVELTIKPDAKETVSFKPRSESGGAKMNGYHDDEAGNEEKDRQRGRAERSNSFGKYKRLEARPLRRSSIASVRKSDRTVRDKGKGYNFNDGLGEERDAKRRDLPPLKMPSRNEARRAGDPERPTTPGAITGTPVKPVAVDINMEKTPPDDRKNKREEERKSVIDAVKTAGAGKSWLKTQDAREGMVQKLGTLERRKAKTRRAMYPPLSTFINPEDKETKEALEEISQIANRQERMHVKVVDISLDDDSPSSFTGMKAADQARPGPKTVSVATTSAPTSSPRSPTSPTSPTSNSFYKPGKVPGRSLVAARTARLTNLINNDFRPPVKDKWNKRDGMKKVSPSKNEPSDKLGKNEEAAPAGSPGTQRRSLPRVPNEEPFHSTKETTKIVQRKQTGKPRFHFGKGKKEGKKKAKDAEDMGFVVVDLEDGISTPERGR